ncbi:D-amino acid aminotransferase [Alkalilimnicola ehrlichii MLHE-1]|uniref:Aminodeoxychorismate lyase n=1 Tax=Alkalilimnicola ehrlichii (strain ATCC BAA-1101 / DSM 17681 / MLHE-1) TaxID=187272 RepID=Q0ACA5_ALKEH|nr:D-amino acid aminotransferase [Alkalilimnicola ehrlichii]ABI55532.1 branched chain amino acid: 2-keto-4-methylthiobutyrate aminotransferase [Alkalilimnicola ehrlichii MLHE-1]
MRDICYLNGEFLPLERACISPMDRGFLFGDGAYEVVPVYGGRPFRLPAHLRRLDQTLAGIRLPNPHTHEHWTRLIHELLAAGRWRDAGVYLQITRGVPEQRDHAFPEGTRPTVFMTASPLPTPMPPDSEQGKSAVRLQDNRWGRCDLKTVALLPNVLLRQQAVEAGADEALLLRDGQLTEGAASNAFVVCENRVKTPLQGPGLLPGVTRDFVVELLRDHGVACECTTISAEELARADEIWLTSSTKELLPVTRLDGEPVGDGRPGPMWRRTRAWFDEHKAAWAAGG